MTPLCTRICPYPFFEATPPGAAPGPRLKPGPVFVASGGVTKPAPRPPTCGCNTGPRTSRPRRRATAPRAGYRRHTQPQSTGAPPARLCTAQGPATSRKHDSKQISKPSQTKGSSPPSQTSATPAALAAAKRAVQLCVMNGRQSSFCRTTARRNNGPEERSRSRRTAQCSTSAASRAR